MPTNKIVEVNTNGRLQFYSLSDASRGYNYFIMDSDRKKIKFFTHWLNDPSHRTADTIVYKPVEESLPNEVSPFQGFTYKAITEPACPEGVSMFENLLRFVCGDNEAAFIYVRNTFAHMIQRPFEKTSICTVFTSNKYDYAKETLIGWISHVLGNHVGRYVDEIYFWRKHDDRKEGAVLMYIEEPECIASKERRDRFREHIVCDDVIMNPWKHASYTVNNIARYFMIITKPRFLDFKDDDNFFVVRSSDRQVEAGTDNETYWNNIRMHHCGSRGSPGWLRAVGEYLEGVDLTGWDYRAIPDLHDEVHALPANLADNITERRFLEQWNGTGVPVSQLYEKYKEFCTRNNMRYKPSIISFGRAISKSDLIRKGRDGRTKHVIYTKVGDAAVENIINPI
jgi:hypothetical protein